MPRNDYKLSKLPDANIMIGGMMSSGWRKWLNDLYLMVGSENNYSADWEPTITGLTGSAVIEDGKYFKFRKILYFNLVINPSGSTSSTLGASYISSLPKMSTGAGDCRIFNATSREFIGHGYIENNSDRIYLPTYSSISDNLTLNGFVFVDG